MISSTEGRKPIGRREVMRAENKIREALAEIEQMAEPRPPTRLNSVDEVIDNVYVTGANLARRVGVSLPTISDWRRQGWFATNTFKLMSEDLAEGNYTAPSSLWRMKD